MTFLDVNQRLARAAVIATALGGTLTATTLGDGSDLPDGSVLITQAQIEAGIVLTGDTSDNTNAVGLPGWGYGCWASDSPDEWYRLEIHEPIKIEIAMCVGTLYNEQIWVQDASGTIIACMGWGCTDSSKASISNLWLAPGFYDLAIDGFQGAAGPYTAHVRERPECLLSPVCTGDPEGEPCADVYDTINGGCPTSTGALGTVTVEGPAICGTTWAHDMDFDSDWYRFRLFEPTDVRIDLRAEMPTGALLARLDSVGTCASWSYLIEYRAFASCEDVGFPAYATLDAGWYAIALWPSNSIGQIIWGNFPCPQGIYTNNAYELRLRRTNACFLDPPCDGELEDEACNQSSPDTVNGGCFSAHQALGSITIDGPAICGTNWRYEVDSDEDWYAFTVEETRLVLVHLRSETPTTAVINQLSPGGTCPIISVPVGDHAYSGWCNELHGVGKYQLEPGTYAVVVRPALGDTFPCPDGTLRNNAYRVSLRSPVLADLGLNGLVDFEDLLIVIQSWGPCTDECPADLDGSGAVDFADILVVILAWGEGE